MSAFDPFRFAALLACQRGPMSEVERELASVCMSMMLTQLRVDREAEKDLDEAEALRQYLQGSTSRAE